MKNSIFMFVGFMFAIAGIVIIYSGMHYHINPTAATALQNIPDGFLGKDFVSEQVAAVESKTANQYFIIGGVLGALGLFFLMMAFSLKKKAAQQQKKDAFIAQNGISTEGKVSFLDKNYRFLVNNTPIYSILEYTYQDSMGTTHTKKLNELNNEMLIRKQIQVGSTVSVKYLVDSPDESVLIL